jgi:hypothetical protein
MLGSTAYFNIERRAQSEDDGRVGRNRYESAQSEANATPGHRI